MTEQLRILLLEDDDVDAKLIGLYAASAQKFRIEIVRAVSTAEANRLLETQRFDACILDFWLGCESSLRFLADLGSRNILVPALILTSLSTPDIRQLCADAGAVHFLGKGRLSTATLEGAIEQVLMGAEDRHDPLARNRAGRPSPTKLLKLLDAMQAVHDRPGPLEGSADAFCRQTAARQDLLVLGDMTEPVRFGLFEQLVGEQGRPRSSGHQAPCDIGDLVERAIDIARAIQDSRGQTIAFARPAAKVAVAADEASLLFLIFELANRASQQSASDSRIKASIGFEAGRLRIGFTSVTPGDANASVIAFGALFAKIMLDHGGYVSNDLDPEGCLALTASFDFPLERALPLNAH